MNSADLARELPPLILAPPYDLRVPAAFREILSTLPVEDEGVALLSRPVQLYPRDDGFLTVWIEFPDGGSVGVVVPPGYWRIRADGSSH